LPSEDDKKGLPPDAALPLGYKPPTQRDIYYYALDISMKEVCPQAILRDLHRVVKDHNVPYTMFYREDMIDVGARFALVELEQMKAMRTKLDLPTEHKGPANFWQGVVALFGPPRHAMRSPYVPKK
jgi:hypothetical protein